MSFADSRTLSLTGLFPFKVWAFEYLMSKPTRTSGPNLDESIVTCSCSALHLTHRRRLMSGSLMENGANPPCRCHLGTPLFGTGVWLIHEPCGAPCPTIPLLIDLPRPPSLAPRTMATFEPWPIGGGLSSIESQSATTALFNSNIEALIVFKGTLMTNPIKRVLESVIVILTLFKVRPFPLSILAATYR